MNNSFPKSENKFIKATMFQDQEVYLTFKGWDRKGNEDVEAKGGRPAKSWKNNLKFQLRYSYPEFAIDEAGEKKLNEKGQPFKNKYWKPEYPHGYSIIYFFEEGQLESGSLPLFEEFCVCQPCPGEKVTIKRTGIDKETKWKVRRVVKDQIFQGTQQLPDIQLEDYSEEAPF